MVRQAGQDGMGFPSYACAIGTEQSKCLARVDRQGERIDRGEFTKMTGKSGRFQNGLSRNDFDYGISHDAAHLFFSAIRAA